MPEALATELIDRLDWPMWLIYAVAATATVICMLLVKAMARLLSYCIRSERSRRAARSLLREEAEQRDAKRRAAAASTASAAAAPSDSNGPKVRWCRFCDLRIEDAFVATHQDGKRHKRCVENAGARAVGVDCWVWLDAPPQSSSEPEPAPTAERDVLVPLTYGGRGGGDGGKGAWKQPKKRR